MGRWAGTNIASPYPERSEGSTYPARKTESLSSLPDEKRCPSAHLPATVPPRLPPPILRSLRARDCRRCASKWHIDKPLTAAKCVDDPTVNPVPPAAPFDTFIGDGIGQLDGVDGSVVHSKFIDAGEPGTSDKVLIKIFAPSGGLVLHVPLTLISGGNIQAHFDQPHDK